ncbi:WD40 repeat histone deacetylase subunit [Cryptosporidium ubiquitum]|uniref:WD40 repeat histone deacetylase subunit n=1 Tax=Cryptosporidium ubiquitum TaxID=857276 RepID=A0A1J4MME6_9CRYT|nr:WD40 repeat histone deacetylase subunit [Cryptosporidium ubiquitum]OII74635.1 WD40 repeat histone deacetylase subunit [Cryptosporidium ubiquitum]
MNSLAQNSPFSSMMNFTFFDQTKNILKSEESNKLEKYKIWKENASLLYENIMTHILEWPSLSVQWMCENNFSYNESFYSDESINDTTKYSLLTGTHTSGMDQDYIIILDVLLPNSSIPEENRKFDSHSDYAGFSISCKESDTNKFSQRILIPHDGEVNRAIHSPVNKNIIASKTVAGDVNIYDLNSLIDKKMVEGTIKTEKTPSLILCGHELEGWALSWNKINESYLASGSDDTVICLWDIQSRPNNSERKLNPILKFRGHEKSVQDISWNPSNENIMISVGDDGLIMMWDIRESASPYCIATTMKEIYSDNSRINTGFKKSVGYSCIGHCSANINSLNTIEFNPFRTNIIAVGGSDPVIALFDVRKMNRRLHSLNGHSGQINRLNFLLESESLLASASSDSTVSIWDLSKIGMEQRPDEAEDGVPELIFTHSGHTSPVIDLCCMMNNLQTTTFASISENNYLHIWNPGETVFLSDDEDEELERIKDIQVE